MSALKKRLIFLELPVLLVLILGLIYTFHPFGPINSFGAEFFKNASTSSASSKQNEGLVASPLTGEPVDQATANLRPLAVMIENLGNSRNPMNAQARPQAGLDKADIVYEALVEGGITRFMAVYQSKRAERVLPVRSARPYYVSWAGDYKAAFFHIGGSPEAASLLASLRAGGAIFDGGASGGWFGRFAPWRAEGRSLEHTAVSDTESMRNVMRSRGGEGNRGFTSFLFKGDLAAEKRPESREVLIINFSSLSQSLYSVRWVYDKENNRY